jgi:hypothetical protein
MSPVSRSLRVLLVGVIAFGLIGVGCSKKRGTPFDPDAGHPDDFFRTHPAEYRAAGASCFECHGADLLGGVAKVSCSSVSRDGRACHPGGPGGHPNGWRSLHTATDPALAPTCAACHDNPANALAPNCFNTSLCHGPRSGHPADWRTAHTRTNPTQAVLCAQCHDNPANGLPAGCFNNSLCHGSRSPHPAGWLAAHSSTDPGQAAACAQCHDNPANSLPPNCFNTSLCHGTKAGHPAGWSAASQHGAAAKGSPGMGSCTTCHGSGYTGGTSGQSCFPCHGWNAPHARSGWDGGGSSHRSTTQPNAGACALCHRSNPGTAGCFNATLCHGSD